MADAKTNNSMAPEASPNSMPKTGVRRVNNIPVYILLGIFGSFLVVMALVGADRSAKQSKKSTVDMPVEKMPGNTQAMAKEIAGDRTAGIIEPVSETEMPPFPEVAGKGNALLIARPENLDLPPRPDGAGLNPPMRVVHSSNQNVTSPQSISSGTNEDFSRIKQAKQQMLEEAMKSRSSVQFQRPTSSQGQGDMLARIAAVKQQANAAQSEDPTAAYQTRLAQLRGILGNGEGAAPQASTKNSYAQFGNNGQGDRWRLHSQPEAPRTPYELRAGFVVPATLISGINSDLPGQIMAQVSQNVYDTPTGKWLLIPQGSRLVGSYSNEVVLGQSRVLVAWQRIVFPDGKAMDIGSMPGADSAGYSGFKDKTNNHYFRLYGSALLMSGVTAGISSTQRREHGMAPTAGSVLSEALGQQLGQVTAQLLAKNMSISPTIEIRPGYRFNVIVTKDLTFKQPYRSFDY